MMYLNFYYDTTCCVLNYSRAMCRAFFGRHNNIVYDSKQQNGNNEEFLVTIFYCNHSVVRLINAFSLRYRLRRPTKPRS